MGEGIHLWPRAELSLQRQRLLGSVVVFVGFLANPACAVKLTNQFGFLQVFRVSVLGIPFRSVLMVNENEIVAAAVCRTSVSNLGANPFVESTDRPQFSFASHLVHQRVSGMGLPRRALGACIDP